MAKYLVLWEVDTARLPVDPEEKKQLLLQVDARVKEQLESGVAKDFGEFGGMKGYAIIEGTAQQMYSIVSSYMPLTRITVHSVMSIDEVIEGVKGM